MLEPRTKLSTFTKLLGMLNTMNVLKCYLNSTLGLKSLQYKTE